ncbi:MAG: hypothetical protein K2H60_13635 [Muribaculaceae bacterium]|nr:hypothetical protein [Muribaculaceae bacterium]
MKKIIDIVIICCCLLTSCASGNGDKVKMGGVRYIEKFPHSSTLKKIDGFHCDEIGLRGVKLVDSLLILSHDKAWTILSEDAKRNYGTCLTFGGGPNEFFFTPNCGAAAYRVQGDSLMAYVCDKDRGKLLRFNITKFIDTGKDSLALIFQSDKMNNSVWEATAIGRDSVLMQVPNDNFTGFRRNVMTSDSIWEPEATKAAAYANVESSDLNILAKVTRSRPDGKKCVEAMVYLNQLNVFDTDGSNAMTICVGDTLDDVGDVQSQWHLVRKETYETASTWDFGFGALYGGSVWDKMGLKPENSKIQFFTWDGVPVFEAILPIRSIWFDLNPISGILYAIDVDEDELVAFDASAILDAYKQVSTL